MLIDYWKSFVIEKKSEEKNKTSERLKCFHPFRVSTHSDGDDDFIVGIIKVSRVIFAPEKS